ncbi:MAG: hypothetical protein NTX59_07050 [Elusimicrobia bacterium]|nr:hypothetical protein [Elusimicrobiota bacterium]
MKKLFIYIFLALFPASAFAEPSGIDSQEIKGKLKLTFEELYSRLDLTDSAYRQLVSTPVITADAYADYNNSLAKTGGEIKKLAEYQKKLSETVEELEKGEPKPDDMQELLDLKAYAAERTEAIKDRYKDELRKLERIAEKMEKQQQAAVSGQAGYQNADPQAVEREKQQQLKLMEKARAMGDKEKEFNAIKQFSAMDPQKGDRMMSSFFDGLSPEERGNYTTQLKADAPSAGRTGAAYLSGPKETGSRPLSRPAGAVVPGIGGTAIPSDNASAAVGLKTQPGNDGKPFITSNDIKLGMWSAVDKLSPTLAAPHLRETKLNIAADAKTDWLEKKRQDFMDLAGKTKNASEKEQYVNVAGNIEKMIGKKSAATSLDGVDQRSEALGEWNTSVSRLMDNSQEGQAEKALVDRKAAFDAGYAGLKTDAERANWIKEHGQEYDESGKKLADFYMNNPQYLKARKTEADAQLFMRSRMADFKDGAEFTSDELGLQLPPGQKVVISRRPEGSLDGARGLSYTDDKGLSHFQSFDDQVRVNEVMDPSGEKRVIEQRLSKDGTVNVAERRPNGKLFRTEEHRPDGTVALEVYGDDGKAAASRVKKPDGSQIEAVVLDKEGIKRTIFTDAKGGSTFELESLSGKDGYPKQSGRVVDGRLVIDKMELDIKTVKARSGDYVFETKIDGHSAGFEVDMDAIKRLPENQRGEAAKAAASVMTGGNAPRTGPLKQFIAQVNQQSGPNDQVSIITGKDDKGNTVYQANILTADGYKKQVLGQWTTLSKEESAGLANNIGLDINLRSAGKNEDINKKPYLKPFRFSGDNVLDSYYAESRTTGNWFTGYGAEADNYVHRYNSDTGAAIKNIKTGTQTLYSSPNILGQTGIAMGTLGKGTVQLTSSALAVAGAGTLGWADKNLQDEFMERAKSNFYGNDVSRNLGKNFIGDNYEKGYARLEVKEDHNIQNVGKEMASMGQPTLGAVLQGGVEFSNGVATSLITAPLGGPALSKVAEKAGTVGNIASKTYSSYLAVKGVYNTGASGVEFVQAYRAFDENDPKSKERYYAAVTDLTANALKSPQTVSGVFKLAANVKEVKNAFTGKEQSTILGADGKPYQKPPEELSSFNKFMLGKNEPGILTRVMTKDISMGMDPRININLSNNPVSNAINSADKWVAAKVDKWTGKPAEMPRPGLILPGQAQPNPDARIIIPGQAAPNPDAKIIVPGETTPNPDAKVFLPGQ